MIKEIFERRSVRKFAAREVEAEKLEAVLRAGMAAPSAGNQRPWEFYIVRDREKLEALSQISRYAGPVAGSAPSPRDSGVSGSVCIPLRIA